MSLTSFLKNDGELRILIDQTFPKPDVEIDSERIAEPQTRNFALVGTAFDYVLRFWLEHRYPGVDSKQWVAHQGVSLSYLLEDNDADRGIDEAISRAEEHHEAYLESGKITDELLGATLDLAKLDWIYRAGQLPDDLGEYQQGDIDDLRTLVEIIPETEFTSADHLLLNPTFGSASRLVSGADADIVLDNTLIDLKTVKDAKLKPDYWRQLVGYLVLANIATNELPEMPRFDQVGIYFSRHGHLWTTSADQIYENEKFGDFESWFEERAKSHFRE